MITIIPNITLMPSCLLISTRTKRINAIDWETDFTIKAYSILVQAYDKLEDDDTAQKQQQKMDAFDQLCWFDPTAVAE